MTFTGGKDWSCEMMMRPTPGNRKRAAAGILRYTLADLDFPRERLCPHIFGNLPDPMLGPALIRAVSKAKIRKTRIGKHFCA